MISLMARFRVLNLPMLIIQGDETLSGLKKNCKRLLASMDSTSLSLVLQDSMNKRW